MSFMRNVCLLAVLFLLSSCSSSKNYFISSDYEDTVTDKEVLIVPVYREQFTETPKPIFGYLNSSQKAILESELEAFFNNTLNIPVKIYDDSRSFSSDSFSLERATLNETEFFILKPQDEVFSDSGFILFIDEFSFNTQTREVRSSSYAGHGKSIKRILYFETKYSLWDNVNKKIAAYGQFNTSKEVSSEVTEEDYASVIRAVLDDIAKSSPLRAKS